MHILHFNFQYARNKRVAMRKSALQWAQLLVITRNNSQLHVVILKAIVQ